MSFVYDSIAIQVDDRRDRSSQSASFGGKKKKGNRSIVECNDVFGFLWYSRVYVGSLCDACEFLRVMFEDQLNIMATLATWTRTSSRLVAPSRSSTSVDSLLSARAGIFLTGYQRSLFHIHLLACTSQSAFDARRKRVLDGQDVYT